MVQSNIEGVVALNIVLATGETIPLASIGTANSLVTIETKDLDFSEPQKDKFIDRLIFDLHAPTGETIHQFYVNVGYRNKLSEPITWLGERQISFDNPHYQLRQTARFFRIKLTDSLPISQWKLSSLEVYGRILTGGRL